MFRTIKNWLFPRQTVFNVQNPNISGPSISKIREMHSQFLRDGEENKRLQPVKKELAVLRNQQNRANVPLAGREVEVHISFKDLVGARLYGYEIVGTFTDGPALARIKT